MEQAMTDYKAADARWWRNLALGAFVGGVFVVTLWAWWGLAGVEWLARYRRGSYGLPSAEELGQTGDIFGGVSALFSALALLGVAVGALIQGHTATVLRKQVVDARRSSEMQLRAYVIVSAADLSWNGIRLAAIVKFKNYGQTPAYGVKTWAVCQSNSPGVLPTFEKLAPISTTAVSIIGPGAEIELEMEVDLGGPPSLETLITGSRIAHLWGIVTYVDVFDVARETSFRFHSAGENARKLKFTPTSEGNTAT